jgi:hypothetical protein
VVRANCNHAFKSLNHGKQTKWNQLAKKVAICRGSLAWLGRQTHNLGEKASQMRNLEMLGAKRLKTRSHGLESRSRHHLFLMLTLFVGEYRIKLSEIHIFLMYKHVRVEMVIQTAADDPVKLPFVKGS